MFSTTSPRPKWVVPIGNAGNITAVMSGFIKFFQAGVIDCLPKIIGVQSLHADPVVRYYSQPDPSQRCFEPVTVKPSTAQAAMIGNPVSMPRVIHLADVVDATQRGYRFRRCRDMDASAEVRRILETFNVLLDARVAATSKVEPVVALQHLREPLGPAKPFVPRS